MHPMRKPALILLMLCLWPGASALAASGQSEPPTEYEVKAGLLYKFLPFIRWPEAKDGRTTLTLAVVGKNPFGKILDQVEGRRIGAHTLRVEYFESDAPPEQLRRCQVVYVAETDPEKRRAILDAVAGRPVLTVADSAGFAAAAGMIGFVTQGGRVAFEINVTSVEKAGLTIRSQLMRLALRIFSEDDEQNGQPGE